MGCAAGDGSAPEMATKLPFAPSIVFVVAPSMVRVASCDANLARSARSALESHFGWRGNLSYKWLRPSENDGRLLSAGGFAAGLPVVMGLPAEAPGRSTRGGRT
jgi:hypothetical protein